MTCNNPMPPEVEDLIRTMATVYCCFIAKKGHQMPPEKCKLMKEMLLKRIADVDLEKCALGIIGFLAAAAESPNALSMHAPDAEAILRD